MLPPTQKVNGAPLIGVSAHRDETTLLHVGSNLCGNVLSHLLSIGVALLGLLDDGTVPIRRDEFNLDLVRKAERSELDLVDRKNDEALPAVVVLLVVSQLLFLSVGLGSPSLFLVFSGSSVIEDLRIVAHLKGV